MSFYEAPPVAQRPAQAAGYTANPRVEPDTQSERDEIFNDLYVQAFGDPNELLWEEYRLEQQDIPVLVRFPELQDVAPVRRAAA